jgi:hypothetical protein
MTKFDPTRSVRCKDGTHARIIATDLNNTEYPIVAVLGREEDGVAQFDKDGNRKDKFFSNGDLENVPDDYYDEKPIPEEMEIPVLLAWSNNGGGETQFHLARGDGADLRANKIAAELKGSGLYAIKTVTFKKSEGLDDV